ncbi:class I SAM-dependent methyltransferase [Curvivirga aplysinae]|uniref:class I SAM-dependent methyltransferase n=1 Tax=Curvivirga aplysinae TaxID=2529852 RepID=UPI0012BD50B8|nr:class I SAM-dependent methyltransferase [Curvivirga aplysinae]MTI10278.1 class I SAM-dependent methyltransferase [Curvivirga aplysinae]
MTDYKMNWEEAVVWLRDQKGQQELVKFCYFDDPVLDAAKRFCQSSEWQALQQILMGRSGRALDLGAGRGISAYALAKEGFDVTALEPNSSFIVGAGAIKTLCDAETLPIEIVEEWGEKLPFEDDVFDVVHCRQVLHHAKDLGDMLKEIARVLMPGGLFIATREHVISNPEELELFLSRHPLHHLYGGEWAYTVQEYKRLIRRAGIDLKQVLNPYESDINRFPRTQQDIRLDIAQAYHFPFPKLIPMWFVNKLGDYSRIPGRLYSFIGTKP